VDLGFTVPYAPKVLSLYAHDAAVERGPMLGLLIPLAAIEFKQYLGRLHSSCAK